MTIAGEVLSARRAAAANRRGGTLAFTCAVFGPVMRPSCSAMCSASGRALPVVPGRLAVVKGLGLAGWHGGRLGCWLITLICVNGNTKRGS